MRTATEVVFPVLGGRGGSVLLIRITLVANARVKRPNSVKLVLTSKMTDKVFFCLAENARAKTAVEIRKSSCLPVA